MGGISNYYPIFIYPLYVPPLFSHEDENTCLGQIDSGHIEALQTCGSLQHASKFTVNENNTYDSSKKHDLTYFLKWYTLI